MSNPIHSTSAKSVLPMLAMRGLATGLCAGCVVGLLRLSHDRAAARVALWLEEWREVWWTVPIWFGVLVALAVILRRIVREEPLISGSGIPQTELALAGRLSFTWWRVLLAKFLGSWLALFGGLALGREGPSIQMGGAVGAGFHALWRPAAPHALTGSPYVVAGAVAGLAAAFGAPAAGVLFAFEEMKSRRDTSLIVAACASAIGAHLMIRIVFGMGRILPFAGFEAPPLSSFWIVALEGAVFGVLGVGYNKTLLWLHDREAVDPGSLEGLAAAAARRMPRAVRAFADRRGGEPDHLRGRARCGAEDAYPFARVQVPVRPVQHRCGHSGRPPYAYPVPRRAVGEALGGIARLGVGRARAGVRFGAAVCAVRHGELFCGNGARAADGHCPRYGDVGHVHLPSRQFARGADRL